MMKENIKQLTGKIGTQEKTHNIVNKMRSYECTEAKISNIVSD